ncbi:hypothetical protein MJD09_18010, partial [bacterium]|nr:hypothetical protein [bacterium]
LSKHKPFIDYKLVETHQRDDDNVTLYYDVIIQRKSGDKTSRQQVLSATQADGQWKINNFETFTKDVP